MGIEDIQRELETLMRDPRRFRDRRAIFIDSEREIDGICPLAEKKAVRENLRKAMEAGRARRRTG